MIFPNGLHDFDREYIESITKACRESGEPSPIEDGVVEGIFTLISFYDVDGTPRWMIRNEGDWQSSHVLGLLEMVKFDIVYYTPGASSMSRKLDDDE